MGERHSVSRLIVADADRLYSMVSDLERMGEWSPENVGGKWVSGGGEVGARFRGRNRHGKLRWSTTAEVVRAVPGAEFEFVVHVVWPFKNLVTWGYTFEPRDDGTLVIEYRHDHRRPWLVWFASKQVARLDDPDAHYRAGMEHTLERLAAAAESSPGAADE